MMEVMRNPLFFQVLVVAASVNVLIGCTASAVMYRNRAGGRYSPLNHFISELGEQGVSHWAGLFNISLILCGACLLPASISLGMMMTGVWAKLGMLAGIVAGFSMSMVGVFPMNKMTQHVRAAMSYFRVALLMIFFFTLAIAFPTENPPLTHPLFSLAGLPAILTSIFFLTYPRINRSLAREDEPGVEAPVSDRPLVSVPAIAEWSIFITTLLWYVLIAFSL